MAADPNAIEQAVSRTLRDNLEKIQRTADELHQAINDLISTCASSRPSNALPPMLRAQTSAASLSATLEVLSRFVTSALQPDMRTPLEQEAFRVPPLVVVAPDVPVADPVEQLESEVAHPIEESAWTAPEPVPVEESPEVMEIPPAPEAPAISENPPAEEVRSEPEVSADAEPESPSEPVSVFVQAPALEPEPSVETEAQPAMENEAAVETEPVVETEAHQDSEPPEAEPIFSVDALPPEEQELHRRAYRVAKVSMQDIKMLHPEDVRLGCENKDLCFRLRDDIEKAHKEYDRRFQSIQSHPVDYFYYWMVEILAGGDAQALGEYPFPSPVLHR
jgi:hypothetical protein